MSVATLILGASGSGKSTSLRNLDPQQTLLIQCIKKPLPFRSAGWVVRDAGHREGNVFQTDDPAMIEKLMRGTSKPIIVVDDFSQVMVHQMMADIDEKGYDKFVRLAKNVWSLFMTAGELSADKRVYILAHTQESDSGAIKIKTIGRLIDEKITLEGYVTICLMAKRVNETFGFSTITNGNTPCKSPIGLFDADFIDNDLAAVDARITEYYGIHVGSMKGVTA